MDDDNSSDGGYDEKTAKLILTVVGTGESPSVMECLVHSNKFTAMIDTDLELPFSRQNKKRKILLRM